MLLKTIEAKLYLRDDQRQTLERWLGISCWFYNRMLDSRIKAWKRRGESLSLYTQQMALTKWRDRIERLRICPVEFERDALRRVDRGFKAFFRRCKAGEKPGFPRFRAGHRYNSIECLVPAAYMIDGAVRIPKLGLVRSRGRQEVPAGTQRALRIIRRASGWFAQVIIDDGAEVQAQRRVESSVGVDVGLTAFATLSDGTKIDNPRWLARSASKLRSLQRRVSRRHSGSHNRRRAILRLRRQYERVAGQRRNFCHQHSTDLVRRYDLIAVENLNIAGLARSRLGKGILDCAWATFLGQLRSKAEYAGCTLIEVGPRGTSQICPQCGAVKRKELSEREHSCNACGLRCDRDHASARVILARALGVSRGEKTSVEESASAGHVVRGLQVDPVKQKVRS